LAIPVKNFWRNKAEQNGTVRMAEGFWGSEMEIVGMAKLFVASGCDPSTEFGHTSFAPRKEAERTLCLGA
jgi:hypothetical protein